MLGNRKRNVDSKHRDYFKNSSNDLKFKIRQTISVLAPAYKVSTVKVFVLNSSHVIRWKQKRRNRSSLIKCSCYGRTYIVCVYPKRIS